MRTSEWPYQVIFTLLTYFAFTFLADFRLLFLVAFPFLFGIIVSHDEWRHGRAVILSALPVLMGVALLFAITFFTIALNTTLISLSRVQVAPAAAGFLILFILSAVLGFPLAWAGTKVGRMIPVRAASS